MNIQVSAMFSGLPKDNWHEHWRCTCRTVNQPKKELEVLADQIKQDQANNNPAEKRVKIDSTFKKAVKKMAQTPRQRRIQSNYSMPLVTSSM